jgi:hypothetical protein
LLIYSSTIFKQASRGFRKYGCLPGVPYKHASNSSQSVSVEPSGC